MFDNEWVLTQLFEKKDAKYREFTIKITPSVQPERIIGVPIPHLRALARSMDGKTSEQFIGRLPHYYYEENNLHGYLIEKIRDYDDCVCRLDSFLPHVDNWATCDTCCPKTLATRPDSTLRKAYEWMQSPHEYTVRFGIKVLMNLFQDDLFLYEYAQKVASVKREEYYIKMMQAWYFAMLLSKRFDDAIEYFRKGALDEQVRKMAVRKAIDSYRITKKQKDYIKTL